MAIHHYAKLRAQLDPHTANMSWRVRDLLTAYGWPSGMMGRGAIGLVELGGGWLSSDVAAFCHANALPGPMVTGHSVNGTPIPAFGKSDADGEVGLDIQLAAASFSVATGQPARINVYQASDIASGIDAAVADRVAAISCSWGDDEAQWDPNDIALTRAAIARAVAAGVVFCACAGDNDSSDGGKTPANVDYPGSDPDTLCCGGTSKTLTTETVWNNNPGNADGSGTGGGYSTVFQPLPSWQIGAPHGPGRMVPDVAANADPNTGYRIWLGGQVQVIGGTSAVAPLYAGFLAARAGAHGWVNPLFWRNPLAFHDITQGDNGMFRARVGPDACTGLGVLNPARLRAILG